MNVNNARGDKFCCKAVYYWLFRPDLGEEASARDEESQIVKFYLKLRCIFWINSYFGRAGVNFAFISTTKL